MKKTIMIFSLSVLFFGCGNTHNGELVKDKYGRYYRLNGDRALGDERYHLELILQDSTELF